MFVFWFFFFQAEDGIRDRLVTGVQTCALPISIILKVGGTSLNAVDISAGGISFDNKNFKLGATYSMEMVLPQGRGTFDAKTEILKIDDKEVCRCKIIGLSPDQEDGVHSYILDRQKEEIAQKKHRSL